jgi:hypothetical protein
LSTVVKWEEYVGDKGMHWEVGWMGPMGYLVLVLVVVFVLDWLGLSMSIFLCEGGLVIIRERWANILSRTRTRTIGAAALRC